MTNNEIMADGSEVRALPKGDRNYRGAEMNTLQIAYKILYSLEHKNKVDYMGQIIGPVALDVPEEEWIDVLQMLLEEGYISGAKIGKDILGNQYADIKNVKITLKGAQYLSENSAMKRFARVATDVITIIKP